MSSMWSFLASIFLIFFAGLLAQSAVERGDSNGVTIVYFVVLVMFFFGVGGLIKLAIQ